MTDNDNDNDIDDGIEVDDIEDDRDSTVSDDTVDDVPPHLKYTRFTNLPNSFLTKDAISSCLFHPSLAIFATHSGFVHIMTLDLSQLIRTFRAHRASVLSIHTDGEYIATASMDGTVVIGSISNLQDIFAVDFKRPIHSVVLQGQYSTTKTFITGGTSGKVISSTRNWLGQRVDTVLEETQSTILELRLLGDLLIWMNDSITFYQLTSKTKLYLINLPTSFPRPDLYWPKLEIELGSLLLGWANTVWSIKLIDSDSRSILSLSSERKIHIDTQFQLQDSLIAGISKINENYLILNYLSSKQPPELKIINGVTLEDVSVDEVELKNFSSLGLNDYTLLKLSPHKWALVGANDVLIVEEFNLNDKLKWYLDNDDLLQAWDISEALLSTEERFTEIGTRQLGKFIDDNEWVEAAKFLSESLGTDSFLQDQWVKYLKLFIDNGKFDEIVDYIPMELDEEIYTSFIIHYLDTKQDKVIELIEKWTLFDTAQINDKIGVLLKDYDQGDTQDFSTQFIKNLRNLHIQLSISLNDYSHALYHLFQNHDPNILQFLSDNHLLQEYLSRIPELITIDLSPDELKFHSVETLNEKLSDRVMCLIDNRHELVPHDMIQLLHEHNLDVVCFLYLQKLFNTSGFISTNFEDEMVRLYTIYDHTQLLNFLQKYKNYDIETAIKYCSENHLIKELVFLYSRIGQNKIALELIINELDDPQYAINFTLSLQDLELFNHLIEYSSDKPEFIKLLIIEAGENNVDLRQVITNIPNNINIENLQKILININLNNKIESIIHEKILKIIQIETMDCIYQLRDLKLKGESMDLNRVPNETIIINEGNTMVESEFIGDNKLWNQIAYTVSDKIRHFIYLKTKKLV